MVAVTENRLDPAALLRERCTDWPALCAALRLSGYLHWNEYIPHQPFATQVAFLLLNGVMEVFYGGAAGGGKSDALLMAAMQYVDVPGYNALIIRSRLTDLKMSSALLERSFEWLAPTDARWDGAAHAWLFPAGASIQFGYLGFDAASSRYKGTEFQCICFDELADFWEEDYTFLFRSLRKLVCSTHRLDARGVPRYAPDCPECQVRKLVPLRMRAASNPPRMGEPGVTGWIHERFCIERAEDGRYYGRNPERPWIRATFRDNPHIDQQGYARSLMHMDPVTRKQLMDGDWTVVSAGRFRREWARRWERRSDYLWLNPRTPNEIGVQLSKCRCFLTVDPAASQREGPGDKTIWKRAPSWSVISTWLVTPKKELIWYDLRRGRWEIPDLCRMIRDTFHEVRRAGCNPECIGIENNGLGMGVYQDCDRMGLPVRSLWSSTDKLVRATQAANRMERGKVFLPLDEPWLRSLEQELFCWTGHPQECADQIDTLSSAAIIVTEDSYGEEVYSAADLLPQAF